MLGVSMENICCCCFCCSDASDCSFFLASSSCRLNWNSISVCSFRNCTVSLPLRLCLPFLTSESSASHFLFLVEPRDSIEILLISSAVSLSFLLFLALLWLISCNSCSAASHLSMISSKAKSSSESSGEMPFPVSISCFLFLPFRSRMVNRSLTALWVTVNPGWVLRLFATWLQADPRSFEPTLCRARH